MISLASVPLPTNPDTLLIDLLAAIFIVFILGLLVGVWMGTRYGAARQIARASAPVPTLFQTNLQPDKYDK